MTRSAATIRRFTDTPVFVPTFNEDNERLLDSNFMSRVYPDGWIIRQSDGTENFVEPPIELPVR